MDLIETFGAKIGALSEEKPQRARQLLTAGFRANGVKNKLASKRSSKSDRMLFQLVNRAMVTCLAKPQSNVMVSLFTPCEMLHLQGLHPYSCEGFSSYLSGAMAEQPFLHQAEDTGIPNSLCSYHKVFIGAAQMGLMPKPRFILSTSLACDANTLTFRHLAQFYDVPHFNVDIPFESSPQAVDYVAGQLRQMGEFLTQQTGLPLDDGQLARTVARSQRTMALYHRGLRLRAGRQVLSDLTSELLRTAAFHFLLGTPETEAYARQLLREITTAPPAQGKQLLWIHTTPYWVAPLRHLFAQSTRVQVAACDMRGLWRPTPQSPMRPWPAAWSTPPSTARPSGGSTGPWRWPKPWGPTGRFGSATGAASTPWAAPGWARRPWRRPACPPCYWTGTAVTGASAARDRPPPGWKPFWKYWRAWHEHHLSRL